MTGQPEDIDEIIDHIIGHVEEGDSVLVIAHSDNGVCIAGIRLNTLQREIADRYIHTVGMLMETQGNA